MIKTRHEEKPLPDTKESPHRKNLYRTFLLSVVLVTALLHAMPSAAYAALFPQDADDAILRIINDSDQTVCYVIICPPGAQDANDCLIEAENIPPGKFYALDVVAGDYDVYLGDCEGNRLLAEQAFAIAGQHELRYAPGPDLCETLNQEGMALYHQTQYRDAIRKFQNALTCYREADDHKGEGTALNNIGVIYNSLEQYQEALDYYQQALAILQEIGDRAGEGINLHNIGDIYDSLGQYQEALDYYQQALAILQEIGNRRGVGESLTSIGVIYASLRQYQEALDYYQQALAVRREVGNRRSVGESLNNIGFICSRLGRYQEALDYYQQALAIQQEIGDRVREGGSLNNIGGIYSRLGQYQEALDTYQQALVILQEIDDRDGEGTTLNNIGFIYASLEQYQKALEHYQQALVIAQEIGDRVGEGVTLDNIGFIYAHRGQYQEALDTHQQVLAIQQEIGDQAGKGVSLNHIGSIYTILEQYEEALDYCQQSLAIRQEIDDLVGESITLDNIGFTYERQNQPEQALLYYEQAMTVFESVRATAGSEAGRASFIAQYADLYDRAVNLYHAQGQDDQAFFTAERGRARAFLDSMSTGYVQLSDAASADLLAPEQAAYAARQAVQDALSRARAQQPLDAALIADLEAQLTTAEEEHAAAVAAIESRRDQLAALVPGRSAVLDLPQVQALLDEQTTLVSFWVLQDQTLAFVVTRDSLHTVTLAVGQANLVAQIIDFHSFPNLYVAHPESAIQLYRWLIEPLQPYLTPSPPHPASPASITCPLPPSPMDSAACWTTTPSPTSPTPACCPSSAKMPAAQAGHPSSWATLPPPTLTLPPPWPPNGTS
jgi:tetratricopeptide (TPR) repeat protein